MKVIFLQDVPRIAQKHTVKDVNDGYALNFLFPRKLAVAATPKAMKDLEKRKKEVEVSKKVQKDLLMKNLEEVKGKRVVIKAKADEKGHLFAQVHEKDIAEAMDEQHNISIDEKTIMLQNK